MSSDTNVNKEEDLELEEGEIADDSNDGCSGDEAVPELESMHDAPSEMAQNSVLVPQKKKKKVVRKVRRKIKIKKKVVRKKDVANGSDNLLPPMNNVLQPQGNILPTTQSNLLQPQSNLPQPQTTLLQPQSNLLQSQSNLLQTQNNTSNNNTNNQRLDSLWEQQILMLQAEQQQSQILRAAATDEDLRIFPSTFLMSHNQSLLHNQTSMQVVSTQQQQLAQMQTMPTVMTTMATTNLSQPLAQHSQIQSQPQPQQQQLLQQQQQLLQQQTSPLRESAHHQTPSSPDDENGKSSYEAISKMLTLLRNSVNVSDSSETNEWANLNTSLDHQQNNSDLAELSLQPSGPKGASIEYTLVPILVEGIDYTKYKLLSQYEPKFKNDPRLNQQS